MVWNVLIVKMSITAFMLLPGWIPETCPVEAPLVNDESHHEGERLLNESTAEGSEESSKHADPEWMLEYRKYALIAFIAGALMCIVSRMTHILAKPGALRHECYMSAYAYLFTASMIPMFIITNLHNQ